MKHGRHAMLIPIALFASGLLAVGLLVVVIVLVPNRSDNCGSALTGDIRVGGHSDLDAEQRANAAAVIAEGRRRRLPDRAIVIALAVANQESHFTDYANDGRGSDLNITQQGIEQSLDRPHEAVGTDHGSLGIFQQQWPWWGTMSDLMNPAKSAGKFYDALHGVAGWARLPLTVAAQRVQRSAYPSAYADDESLARALLRGSSSPTLSSAHVDRAVYTGRVSTDCEQASAGTVVFPLPRSSGYHDLHNWGGGSAHWSHGHTGTDLSVACGTPVLAAHAGKVVVRTDQPWAGRWLVQITTGAGRLTTWYAHMRSLDVSAGQHVAAGQQIGEVGDLGNATGCHLHFEVHPHGGSIYQDNVNPTTWLYEHVGHQARVVLAAHSAGPRYPRFVLATFNTLGSSHTSAHGNKPWMASGPKRTRGVVTLLRRHHVDVAGLQEFQRPQQRAFVRLAGAQYAVYSPSRGDTDNSIVWRRDHWQLVSAKPFPVPYFDGHPRPMSLVTLKSRLTGGTATFLNVHNPADTGRFPRQSRWRAAAMRREVAVVRRLAQSGQQVFVTGDMNDHRAAYCAFTRRAHMSNAIGRSHGRRCHAPRHRGIDWIFQRGPANLSAQQVFRDRSVRQTTDHPVVVVTVR